MSFIKRHKFLSVVFAVCILLMIKNSSVPYLFTPPSFVSLPFDKPRTEFFLGVAQMVDISMERSLEKGRLAGGVDRFHHYRHRSHCRDYRCI